MMFRRYEHESASVASRPVFLGRLFRHFLLTLLVVAGSLLFDTLGYHYWGACEWLDALLNASMILTGAVFYALNSGIAFLSMVAILIAPVAHRFLHRLRAEFEEDK